MVLDMQLMLLTGGVNSKIFKSKKADSREIVVMVNDHQSMVQAA